MASPASLTFGNGFLDVRLSVPPAGDGYTYSANDVSVGRVDSWLHAAEVFVSRLWMPVSPGSRNACGCWAAPTWPSTARRDPA